MANILIVDDSNTMRQMVAYTLESAGHTVTEAIDAASALQLTNSANFDLVITDVNMPGMNGLELVRQLRQQVSLKTKPILVLTTEAGADKKSLGRQAGATGWIIKPFDPQSLLEILPRVLN
jgi:two-component system, chemotaxis family, chemotaxis protein CheY